MNVVIGALLTLFAVAIWGVAHSLLAAPRTKDWVRRRIGPSSDRGYRLFYNVVAVVTLLPALAITAAAPGAQLYRIPSPWVFLTTALQLLALVVIVLTVMQTGAASFLGIRQLFGSNQPDSGSLQVSGFYRWVRHPLYTAGLVFIWLSPIMTTSTLALYLGFSLYIIIGSRYEERQLVAIFGEPYQEYRRKVPALIPRPWKHY